MDGYDFVRMAAFKTSDGIELKKGIVWEKAYGESHHYLGYYKVPKAVGIEETSSRVPTQ